MLVVTGDVEIDESSLEAINVAAATMAKASRAEEGCHGYAFYQDIENPLRFRVYEQWTDEAALAFHFATPHMAVFQAALANIKVTAMNVRKYERGETKPIV